MLSKTCCLVIFAATGTISDAAQKRRHMLSAHSIVTKNAPTSTSVGARGGSVRCFLLRRPTTLPNCSAPYQTALRPMPRSLVPTSGGRYRSVVISQYSLLLNKTQAYPRRCRTCWFCSECFASASHSECTPRSVYEDIIHLLEGNRGLVACTAYAWKEGAHTGSSRFTFAI